MSVIRVDEDFLDLDGKVLNGHRECCIQKSNGDLAIVKGELVTIMVKTPDDILNLKKVSAISLLADYPKEPPVDPEEKYEKFKLFEKFHKAEREIDLTSKEVEIAKKWIAKYCNTYIMGVAYNKLDV